MIFPVAFPLLFVLFLLLLALLVFVVELRILRYAYRKMGRHRQLRSLEDFAD